MFAFNFVLSCFSQSDVSELEEESDEKEAKVSCFVLWHAQRQRPYSHYLLTSEKPSNEATAVEGLAADCTDIYRLCSRLL